MLALRSVSIYTNLSLSAAENSKQRLWFRRLFFPVIIFHVCRIPGYLRDSYVIFGCIHLNEIQIYGIYYIPYWIFIYDVLSSLTPVFSGLCKTYSLSSCGTSMIFPVRLHIFSHLLNCLDLDSWEILFPYPISTFYVQDPLAVPRSIGSALR